MSNHKNNILRKCLFGKLQKTILCAISEWSPLAAKIQIRTGCSVFDRFGTRNSLYLVQNNFLQIFILKDNRMVKKYSQVAREKCMTICTDYGHPMKAKFKDIWKIWPYLKIWDWDWIFGRIVKVISSLGVRSPCLASKIIDVRN